jgi:hypothetical protein
MSLKRNQGVQCGLIFLMNLVEGLLILTHLLFKQGTIVAYRH